MAYAGCKQQGTKAQFLASLLYHFFSYDHYDGNDCYVLPSSNPDSPDFFPLDDVTRTLVKDQTTPDAIKEYFEQEDLKQYQTGNGKVKGNYL